jgi:hypothetical protein
MSTSELIQQELQQIAAHNAAITKSMDRIKRLQEKEDETDKKKKVVSGVGAAIVANRNAKLNR